MAPKKKLEPGPGQRSIASFFAAKSGKQAPEPQEEALPAPAPIADAPPPADAPAAQPATGQPAPAAARVRKAPGKKPATGSPGGAPGAEAVGRGVRVFWADDSTWYDGEVAEFDAAEGKHLVCYDDGDEEWLALGSEQYEFVTKPAAAAAGRKRKVRRAVVESDTGSEYAASSSEDDSRDEESLVEEEESEEGSEEETSPLKKARRPPAKKRAAAPRGGRGGRAARASPGKTGGGTPAVAVANGSVGLTPAEGEGGGSAVAACAPPSTAAKGGLPPRPLARTPAAGGAARTPAAGGGSALLRSVLDRTPGGATPAPSAGAGASPASSLKDAVAAEGPERFAGRDAQRFPFLHPDRRRDAAKRRPGDPGYDPRMLHIPPEWFKQNKVSPGQQQWWEFKCQHFDAVLLFKMGKFYELFEMDAHTGVEVLGLSYMKEGSNTERVAGRGEQRRGPAHCPDRRRDAGTRPPPPPPQGDQPHAGFPEAAYHQFAERLARAGHKVVVIEQTETPALLAARNEERRRQGKPKDTVVRREKVAVLTKGSLTDGEMLGTHPDASYLLALAELPVPPRAAAAAAAGAAGGGAVAPRVWLGACAADAATGQLLVGQWLDDDMRSQLRGVLTAVQPVEVVLPRGGLSAATRKVLDGILRDPRVNELAPGAQASQFWDAGTAWARLSGGGYFAEGEGEGEAARGGGTAGARARAPPRPMPPVLRALRASGEDAAAAATALGGCVSYLQELLLDKQVLSAGRVELLAECYGIGAGVLENAEGGATGSLLAALDHCVTPAGRRRLRQWLCRPLHRIADIEARQDAVADLMGPAEDAACTARKLFSGLADLERALARLGAAGAGAGPARDAPHVVLYEDTARRRVQAATDWAEAESTGRVVPAPGVDAAYDATERAIEEAEEALKQYLKARVCLAVAAAGGLGWSLKVPADWEPCQTKKGVRRYTNAELRGLVRRREEAFDAKERAQSGILQDLMRRFAESKDAWAAAVDCMAQLDALMSLAAAALGASGPVCRPRLVPCSPPGEASAGAGAGAGAAPLFRARGLRHPAGITGGSGGFVPNDVELGGDAPPFVVLTGPNMGGKSTLMRQVCLAALMAQVGACVPAESLELTPVDAVFVRMGARDRIMLGQSTFFVELSETSAALNRATPRSLVILDELGRGTATSDGAAIAAAVLDHLAGTTRCRGLFATHYHHISDSHAADPNVAIKHMACKVSSGRARGGGGAGDPGAEAEVEEVTFLYKLTDGSCPRSYGVNVARLAGLPDAVVRRAAEVSEQVEAARKGGGGGAGPCGGESEARPMDVDGGAAAGPGAGSVARGAAQLLRRVAAAVGGDGGEGGWEGVREAWTAARRQLAVQ
eukprot:scaffold2.g7330.t1